MSNNRITINPQLLTWAIDRAGLEMSTLTGRFPKLAEWEAGTVQPTLRQLEQFAHAVQIPIGYLFLPRPLEETIPIPDFRTVANCGVKRPSPDLLDTVYLCQQRQDWYRDYGRIHGLPKLDFIGSVTLKDNPIAIAAAMGEQLGISVVDRQRCANWTEALRQLMTQAEGAGVLVMASSIVGSNSHRKLKVSEFRGFALADDLAPLVFLNGADSKAAQMFTLAHELAHLWLGESGVSDTEAGRLPDQAIERWCNEVAAELLMPIGAICGAYEPGQALEEEVQRLARLFKVSTLVVLRRLCDAGVFSEAELWQRYGEELERLRKVDRGGTGGGDFYRTLGARTGKRFARALIASTLEGQTLFQDAFRLLCVKKSATFYQAARELGVML